ncbi:MAG: ABC-2 transporter permease [Anaerolineaceae bacterium]|nr:MAG: ABC-2 transporter permease [Anaerolineaceae bacterium]
MKGLIVKDFINVSNSFRLVGVMVLFYGAISFLTESPGSFSGMFTLIFAMFLFGTFSLDELANWDSYALTMPLTRENIIQGKYLMMLLLTLIGFLVNAASLLVINIATKAESIFSGFEVPIGGFVIVIIFYSVLLPIIAKVGITKARIYFILIYMVPFLLGMLIFKKVKEDNMVPPERLMDVLEMVKDSIYIIAPLVMIVFLGISYSLSVGIYRKKEF